MPSLPASPAAETTEQRVLRLLKSWREQTAYLSSSTRMTENPAYQELMTLGNAALPFLFRDLEQTKDGHLAKALGAITGARPVPAEDRGQIAKVAEAWLTWARENGYRW
jgi:hypothetical protein